MSRPFLTLMLAAVLGVLQAGCEPIRLPDEEVPVPAGTMSVHVLAGRLRMRVDQSSRSLACLTGPFNRILVMGEPNSRVYVNGRPVGSAGGIRAVRDVLFVPESLEPQIRAALRDGGLADRGGRDGGITKPREPNEAMGPRPVKGLVVLDAGHGGKDPGAKQGGIVEKELNLTLVQMVAENLKARGAKVVLTRADDTSIELPDRPEVANRRQADVFLSIHANSIQDKPWISGFQVYVSDSPSQASISAALAIARRLWQAGISNYGTEPHRRPYQVLVHNRRPAVLLEVGFLTNAAEASRLKQSAYQRKLADAVAEGIADFLGSR
jgi:N-acetylmuramoyl-L-alanine amidase